MALLVGSSAAVGQELTALDGVGWQPVPGDGDVGDLVTTWAPESNQAGAMSAGALFEHTGALVVRYEVRDDGSRTEDARLLSDLFGAHVQLHMGLGRRTALAVDVPVWVFSSGADGPNPAALGDTRVSLPIGIALPTDRDLGLAAGVVPFVDLPTGAAPLLLGNRYPGGGLVMSVGARTPWIRLAANAGMSVFAGHDLPDVGVLRGHLSAGVAVPLSDAVAVAVEAISQPFLGGGGVPLEAMALVRGHDWKGVHWTVGGAYPLLGEPAGVPDYRVFVGVGLTLNKEWDRYRTYDPDLDGDGLPASIDPCPTQAEVVNGWRDDDGCADALSHATAVVVGFDGQPLDDATLTVHGERMPRNEDGAFELGRRMPGQDIGLLASHPNYAVHEPMVVPLQEGDTRYTVKLSELAAGKVNVVAKAAELRVDGLVSFDGPREVEPIQLGGDGEATIELYPGSWTIEVTAEGFEPVRREVNVPIGAVRAVSSVVELVPVEGAPEP